MGITSQKDYLSFLEQKEKRIVFYLKSKPFSHGELSSYIRIFKGVVFGFGLGNVLIHVRDASLLYGFIILTISFCLSLLLINYERRAYRRKSFMHSVKKTLLILLACLFFSSVVLLYSTYKGFIVVLALELFFASLTYSME